MEILLSKNFRLSEFLTSRTALMYGITNDVITIDIVNNISNLVNHVLQPLRDELGIPLHINSGYRCKLLNKKVKGVKSSQHLSGMAADITCADNLKALKVLQAMEFDQLLVYGPTLKPRFIHVSYNSANNRRQYIQYP